MNEKELRKAYDAEWKQKEPQKYLAWLICYIGDLIPLAIMVITILTKGINDDTVGTVLICLVLVLVLGIISAVLQMQHKKGWPAYRDAHMKK